MAVWGSGTLEDPWKVTDWDNFVDKCNAPAADAEERHYIEFPTHDQNGTLIPPEQRIIDMRYHDWYVDVKGDSGGIIYLPSSSMPYKTIEGNGWTILGLSLRNSNLFYIGRTKYTGTGMHRTRSDEISNLNFQNIYLHGACYIFCCAASKSRISVSGCKFSGVSDNSINNLYGTVRNDSSAAIFASGTLTGYMTATSCSFNFKFVNLFKAALLYGTSGGVRYDGMEFNNCLFNIDGKVKPTSNTESGANNHNSYYMLFAVFYFCKITGRFIVDGGNSNQYAYLFSDVNGSLNVIDIYFSSPIDGFAYYHYWFNYLRNANEVSIHYAEYNNDITKNFLKIQTYGGTQFKIPTNRAQMTDKTWLENQGFVIGTAPTT